MENKKGFSFFVLMFVVLGLIPSFVGATALPSPYIDITAPNGGESIQLGQLYTITWSSGNFSINDDVEISLQNTSVVCAPGIVGCQGEFFIGSTKNTGSYVWNTNLNMSGPSTGPNSIPVTVGNNTYKIKVRVVRVGGSDSMTDYSNSNFSIISIPIPACQTLYWTDDANKTCNEPRQFCGTFAYQGLKTFNNYSECISSLSIKVTYDFGTVTLRNGSRGEAVKELQRFLNQVLSLGLVVDGKLGPKTIAVIKQWQKDHDLTPDGLVGKKTKAMMNQSI